MNILCCIRSNDANKKRRENLRRAACDFKGARGAEFVKGKRRSSLNWTASSTPDRRSSSSSIRSHQRSLEYSLDGRDHRNSFTTAKIICCAAIPADWPNCVCKYYCPLCRKYYSHILETGCCENYVCHQCRISLKQKLGTSAAKLKCMYCSHRNFSLVDSINNVPKPYRDEHVQKLRSQAFATGSLFPKLIVSESEKSHPSDQLGQTKATQRSNLLAVKAMRRRSEDETWTSKATSVLLSAGWHENDLHRRRASVGDPRRRSMCTDSTLNQSHAHKGNVTNLSTAEESPDRLELTSKGAMSSLAASMTSQRENPFPRSLQRRQSRLSSRQSRDHRRGSDLSSINTNASASDVVA